MADLLNEITIDAALMLGKYPDWRAGQAVFNVAMVHAPNETNELRGTDVDPFHDDTKILAFMNALQQKLGGS